MRESLERIKNQKETKNNQLFLMCDCYSEVLFIEHDEETQSANLCIYSLNYRHKLSFWQKMRYIYQVLIHNRPYSDQIILHKQQTKDMISFLTSMV